MNEHEISKILKKVYFRWLIPAIFLTGLVYLLKFTFGWQNWLINENIVSDIIITLAVIIGVAIPIIYRIYFVFRNRDKKKITVARFIGFEKILIVISLLTPYFLVLSIGIGLKNTANIVITLLALYSIYFYFPSERKIQFEMKIFRIKSAEINQ